MLIRNIWKKSCLGLLVLAIACLPVSAQLQPQADASLFSHQLDNKGKVFVYWGWNHAKYSNSDIRLRGADYDLQLNEVVAHDRQTPFSLNDYFNPTRVTIPQTNIRIGYFISKKGAIVLALDHMKYLMDQKQTVSVQGFVSNPKYRSYIQNGKVDFSDENFLTFEHTDGLNYINLGYEYYGSVYRSKNFKLEGFIGLGGGVLMPKSNIKLFGNERSDRFHLAGFGTDLRLGANIIFCNHLMARAEVKYGYINMPDIMTTIHNRPDWASQDFSFAQVNFGIGYIFNT